MRWWNTYFILLSTAGLGWHFIVQKNTQYGLVSLPSPQLSYIPRLCSVCILSFFDSLSLVFLMPFTAGKIKKACKRLHLQCTLTADANFLIRTSTNSGCWAFKQLLVRQGPFKRVKERFLHSVHFLCSCTCSPQVVASISCLSMFPSPPRAVISDKAASRLKDSSPWSCPKQKARKRGGGGGFMSRWRKDLVLFMKSFFCLFVFERTFKSSRTSVVAYLNTRSVLKQGITKAMR